MGLWSFIRKAFGSSLPSPGMAPPPPWRHHDTLDFSGPNPQRSAHWLRTLDRVQTVDEIEKELRYNSDFFAIPRRYANSCVGVGPQVSSGDDRADEYFLANHQAKLASTLWTACFGLMTQGDFFLVSTDRGISLVDPLLFCNPRTLDDGARRNTVDGIEYDDFGNPVRYWMRTDTAKWRELKPEFVHHGYLRTYAGQLRGFPWLGPGLASASHMRDLDGAVVTAAITAARHPVVLEMTADGMSYYREMMNSRKKDDVAQAASLARCFAMPPPGASIPLNDGSGRILPPAFKANPLKAEHPTASLDGYRRMLRGSFAAAAGVPISVATDPSGMSFAGARFDDVTLIQDMEVVRQNVLDFACRWYWRSAMSRAPVKEWSELAPTMNWPLEDRHTDPTKEANADATNLQSGAVLWPELRANKGYDPNKSLATLAEWVKRFEAVGLHYPFGVKTIQESPDAGPAEDDEEQING